MTPLISCLIIAGVLAIAAVFIVGLCMAASEVVPDVVEDTGEYE